jgi:hypothetical protein
MAAAANSCAMSAPPMRQAGEVCLQCSSLRRSIVRLTELMRKMRHWSLKEQAEAINQVLRGHYAYYGLAGSR